MSIRKGALGLLFLELPAISVASHPLSVASHPLSVASHQLCCQSPTMLPISCSVGHLLSVASHLLSVASRLLCCQSPALLPVTCCLAGHLLSLLPVRLRCLCVQGKGTFPCETSVLEMHTDLDWNPQVTSLNVWPLYICDDGNVIYYR